MKHVSRIFRLEHIEQLAQYLLQQLGIAVPLGHANANPRSDRVLAGASGLRAGELDDRGFIHPDSFRSSRHAAAIREYYREDFALYDAAV